MAVNWKYVSKERQEKIVRQVRCINGHFYDADTYSKCPHCDSGEYAQVNGNGNSSDNKLQASMSEFKSIDKLNNSDTKKKHWWKKQKSSDGYGFKEKGNKENQISIDVYDDVTVELPEEKLENDIKGGTIKLSPVTPKNVERPDTVLDTVFEVEKSNYEEQKSISIPKPISSPEDSQKTVMIYQGKIEPVTGWLVCVKGEKYGQCFNIAAGKNNIGRSPAMDIVIDEPSVSREKQAIIIFEPIKQKFLLQAGEGNSLTYVNEELLMEYMELKPYDRILMGQALFIFVPFSGEYFNWSNYPDE